MPGPADVLAELLGGGRIVSIGGMGDGPPAFDYQESAARLRRMFNGDDADAQAVHAFLASMDVWEEFSQVQEKSNVRVSATVVRVIKPIFEFRMEKMQALEDLGAVREIGVCNALGNPLPEERQPPSNE